MAANISTDPDALPQLIGEFRSVDVWQAHINDIFYGLRGARVRDYYQTFATADYRLAYALAEDYYRRLRERADSQPASTEARTYTVMEWGGGNGNLAACFLDRVKALDTDGRFYPHLRYLLLDKHEAALAEARQNAELSAHEGIVSIQCRAVEDLASFEDGSVDRILCNELWSELPTKLVLRSAGELNEEHLRPNVSESKLAEIADWSRFVKAFDERDIDGLREFPSFLEDLVWEREYHAVEAKSLAFRRTVNDFLKFIDEDVLVPVNVGAAETVREALRLLAPDAVGLSCFDAGTYDERVLNDAEKPCYSVQGGQFSFLVNFALLEETAKHLGAKTTRLEAQREFVERGLGTSVLTVMDLLAAHPNLPSPDSWQADAHIVRTLAAVNTVYRSPYARTIDFPIRAITPEAKRPGLEALVRGLKTDGVPDTIAYVTADEIRAAKSALEPLGYDDEGIRMMLQAPPQSVDYTHFFLSSSS